MATTADILNGNSAPKVPSRWAAHYRQLVAERDRLMARDFSEPVTSLAKLDDLAEAAAEESQRCLSLVAASATQSSIFEVLAALRRIARGTYGVCEMTGDPIEPERLKAIPWARYSLQGQKDLESSGMGRRTGLPALEPLGAPQADSDDEESSDE